MENFPSRLRKARERTGHTQTSAAKCIGISPKTMSGYENDVSSPDYDTLQKIASLYGVTTDYLLGLESAKPSNVISLFEQRMEREGKMFPYEHNANKVGGTHAGYAKEVVEELYDTHPLPPTVKPSPSRNWLEVEGDCMDGGKEPIKPGYLVLVDRELQFKSNDLVVVTFRDDYSSMLRKVKISDKGSISLIAANMDYDPIYLDERNDVEIYGVVIDISHNLQGRKKRVKEDGFEK